MKKLIVVLVSTILVAGCGIGSISSGVNELNDTGDRLVNAIEENNRTSE